MADLIFHHYPNSPFSEKVRLIFGYKNLTWRSVTIPVIMPKPDLTALTGGYRRTPVLQIGADIYCDSALICDVLERLQPTPALTPAVSAGMDRILAQWADSTLFWTAIAYSFQPEGMQRVMSKMTPEAARAFGADRAAMRGNAPRMPLPEATGQLAEYLRRIAAMLAQDHPFLLGATPTLADFAVYHPLWFVQKIAAVPAILEATPAVLAWMARMAAIGHGTWTEMDSSEAIAVARSASLAADAGTGARFVDHHGVAIGDRVAVLPTDYALDAVEGILRHAGANTFIVEREDARAGTVRVHFPRVGFQLKTIQETA